MEHSAEWFSRANFRLVELQQQIYNTECLMYFAVHKISFTKWSMTHQQTLGYWHSTSKARACCLHKTGGRCRVVNALDSEAMFDPTPDEVFRMRL